MKKKFILSFVGILLIATAVLGNSNYRIVEEKDISMKTLTKGLSSYRTAELASLPVNVRKKYGILVTPDLSKEEYTEVFNNIISDITQKDSNIDEISLWIYDDEDALDFGYNVARVLWHPAGGWGFSVTPEIATSNDRTGYKTIIEWTDKYKLKFKNGQKIEKTATRKNKTTGSESTYYKYSVTYPDVVKPEQINKIAVTIFNKTNRNDKSLTIANIEVLNTSIFLFPLYLI